MPSEIEQPEQDLTLFKQSECPMVKAASDMKLDTPHLFTPQIILDSSDWAWWQTCHLGFGFQTLSHQGK